MVTKIDMGEGPADADKAVAENLGIDITMNEDLDLPAEPDFPEDDVTPTKEDVETPEKKPKEDEIEEKPEKVETKQEAGDETPEGEAEADPEESTELLDLQEKYQALKAQNLVLEEVISPFIEVDEATGEKRYKVGVKELVQKIETGGNADAIQAMHGELSEMGLDDQQIEAMFKVASVMQDKRDRDTKDSVISTRYEEHIADFVANHKDFKQVYPTMKLIFEELYGALPVQQQKAAIVGGKIALESVYKMACRQLGFKTAVAGARAAGEEVGKQKATRAKGSPRSVTRGGTTGSRARMSNQSHEAGDERGMSDDQLADRIVSVEKVHDDPLRKMFGPF